MVSCNVLDKNAVFLVDEPASPGNGCSLLVFPYPIDSLRTDRYHSSRNLHMQVRLKNINLRMMLKKVESNLRAKEQLAEG